MTWKPPSLASMTMLGLLVLDGVGVGEASAQFGFFFPQQGSPQRGYRPRARANPRKPPKPQQPVRQRQLVPVQPLAPEPVFPLDAGTPLPPPRPSFPGDQPEAVPMPAPQELPKPAAGSTTNGEPETKPAGDAKTPLELVKPNMPSRPEPPTASPSPDAAPAAKPSMTVKPVPDELPPKGLATSPERPKESPPALRPGSEPTKPEPTKPEPATPPPSAAVPGSVPPAPAPPLPPEKPAELKPATPGIAPSGARLGETPGQPEDDATCQDRLKSLGVSVEPATIGPQPDERCTVVRPVHLLALTLPGGDKVEFPEHPTIACTTADAFSTYVRDLLSPLAKGALGSPVSAVWTGPGLECRSRDHIVGAKLSAHGQGLAIDIAQLKLADGRKLEVGREKDEVTQTFEVAARRAACGYFHTVLGPGTDAFHATHWHFDLIVRGSQGDNKYCR